MASGDYDAKIQKLFEEGKKLGAPGMAEIGLVNGTGKREMEGSRRMPNVDMLELEREFDLQNKQANRLQEELNATRDRIIKTGQAIANENHNARPSSVNNVLPENNSQKLLYSNANTNSNNSSIFPPDSHSHFRPINDISSLTKTKMYLENALEDSQTQVRHLSSKIEDMERSASDQKDQFRLAIEDLQRKLQETVAGRKKLAELRQRDIKQQGDMIHRLQTTLKELATSNEMQEQALLDAHERMEILENRNQSNEQAMTQIRSILSSTLHKDAARSKSSRLTDSERITELVPELLVTNLERFVSTSYEEADSLRNKVLQLEAELNAAKQAHEADRMIASSDSAEAITATKMQYEEALMDEKAKCRTAEEHLELLSSEMKVLQVDNNTQTQLVAESRDVINQLNKQIDELRSEHHREKGDFQSKIVCMEYDLKLACDINKRLDDDNLSLKEKVTDMSNHMQQIIVELNSEREQRKSSSAKEGDLGKEISGMRLQIDEKTSEISRLREIVAQLRGDLSTKVAKEINEAGNAERIKADVKISSIMEENIGLREELSRTKASLEAVERQLSDVISERSETMQMVKEKDKQVDRLTSQLSLSDRKLIEEKEARKTLEEKLKHLQEDYAKASQSVRQTQSDLERAKSVTDDRERVVVQLRHQVETKIAQSSSLEAKVDDLQKENTFLKSEIKEKNEAIDRLNGLLKVKEQSLADYESRMGNLIEEKSRIVADIHGIETQVTNLMKIKEEQSDELNETRSQLTRLIDERDSLTKELVSLRNKYAIETGKLQKQLQSKKRDLQNLQDTLHTVKNIDGKAAVIAANMQKEVTDKRAVIDSLQTELSKVYDKLELAERENKVHRRETIKLNKQIDEMSGKLKKSESDLKNISKTEKGYRLGVERLQQALEKAAARNAEAQSMIDRQEKELSTAHIRRNLDMMDKRIPSTQLGMVEERPAQIDGGLNVFGRPPIQANNNGLLQNMLARILSTMATQAPSHETSMSGPPRSDQGNFRQASTEAQVNLSSNDIFKVLSEVRDHLATQNRHDSRANLSASKERLRRHKFRKSSKLTVLPPTNESSEFPIVFAHSDVSTAQSDPSNATTLSDDTIRRSHSQDFLLTSSPCKLGAEDFGEPGNRPPSPVSLLLAGGDASLNQAKRKGRRKTTALNTEEKSKNGFGDVGSSVEKRDIARDKFVKDAISDNAEELCRQLQNRLEGLTKIGGKLERQNKVAAKLIKKQDEKLQFVRESGRKLK